MAQTSITSAGQVSLAKRGRRWRFQTGPHLILLFLVATSFYPLVFTLLASLKSNAQYYSSFWMPTAPFHWENYAAAWHELYRGIINSAIVSSVSVVGVVLMSSLAAWTFARYKWPGKELLYYLILGLMMVPSFLTLVPLYWIVREIHLSGSLAAVFMPYLAGGQVFPIFLMRTFFENLPAELFDSARVDGAGEFTTFFKIGLPMCVPIVITVAMLDIMNTWNDFFWPMLAVGQNRDLYTVMVRTFNLTGLMPEYGLLTSAYVIISVPMILIFIVGMRYYISGLTSGAIKM